MPKSSDSRTASAMAEKPLQLCVSNRQAVAASVRALRRGRIIAFPTETVYGLAVRGGDAVARRRLSSAKGRETGKPFQLLVSSRKQAERIAPSMPDAARALANAFWPGPLTLVVRDAVARWQGLRVPDHSFSRAVAAKMGGFIVSTSANRAGEPPARNACEIQRALGDKVNVIIDGGEAGAGKPSTVVKVWQRKWQLLREGAISRDQIERAISGARGKVRKS